MRLGKIARSHDIPVQELISFLNTCYSSNNFHPNAKLDEEMMHLVSNEFAIDLTTNVPSELDTDQPPTEEVLEAIENVSQSAPEIEENGEEPFLDDTLVDEELNRDMDASEIAMGTENEEEAIEERVETNDPITELSAIEAAEDEVQQEIMSDEFLEMIESEDAQIDFEKIKVIKAPKKELSGLTVLGKIELPVEKPRPEKKEKDQSSNKREISEVEKEKRRLKAKRKKEAYLRKKEKRQKEQDRARLKAKGEAHYKQKLEQAETQKARKAPKQTVKSNKAPEKPKPKTILGKFWRWLNT